MLSSTPLLAAAPVGTVIFIVLFVEEFAVNVSIVAPFFWIVSVALFTVGIVGLLLRSL